MIQHVALETARDEAPALVAFLGLLGFVEVEPPPALAERSQWVARAGTQVHVLYAQDAVAPPKGHVAVVAPDYDAALARIRAAGHAVDERPRHWGSPRCFVRAPGGHRVEIMQFPPHGR